MLISSFCKFHNCLLDCLEGLFIHFLSILKCLIIRHDQRRLASQSDNLDLRYFKPSFLLLFQLDSISSVGELDNANFAFGRTSHPHSSTSTSSKVFNEDQLLERLGKLVVQHLWRSFF